MKAHDHRAIAFRRLHASGCFAMPNPWDVGSARALFRSRPPQAPIERGGQRRGGFGMLVVATVARFAEIPRVIVLRSADDGQGEAEVGPSMPRA